MPMSTTIEDRVILLLREKSGGVEERPPSSWCNSEDMDFRKHGFWERLAGLTGISAQRWRKAYVRRQRPTPDMIEALCCLFPEHAFWVATGITDSTNGHVAPMTALTFPERLYRESGTAKRYFRKALELSKALFERGHVDVLDEKQRMSAAERTMSLAHWVGGPLVSTSYDLSKTEGYQELLRLWEEREAERNNDVDRIKGVNRPWVKRLEELRAAGARLDPVLGSDPRTAHQDQWDLFYIPKPNDDQAS